jgi:hypothetical protein
MLQVQPDDLTLRSMDVAQLQKKLFPLHPVTLAEFKSNTRVQESSNSEINQRLLWRTMAEDLSEDQVMPALHSFYRCLGFPIALVYSCVLCNATFHALTY